MNALHSLQTEALNPNTTEIDLQSTLDICRIINNEDTSVAVAVRACLPEIARAIDLIVERLRQNGRMVFLGAGTSGRLGVLDASELPPTFSASPAQFTSLIAGGDHALRHSSEGAEDSIIQPLVDLSRMSLSRNDALIGIAASGRTPYVVAGLAYGSSVGAATVGIACVRPSILGGQLVDDKGMARRCDCVIECVTGAEVIGGSTRMKAGTATKMILNMVSTGVMIRLGKTYGNLMVDLKVSNTKLTDRACRIFHTLLPHHHLTDTEIQALVRGPCEGSLKLALIVAKLGCSINEARTLLKKGNNSLRNAWKDERHVETTHPWDNLIQYERQLVLCIDAGGSKCRIVLAGRNGVLARVESGACNYTTDGANSVLQTLMDGILRAVALLPRTYKGDGLVDKQQETKILTLPLPVPLFAGAWIGMAGLGRANALSTLHSELDVLLSLPDPGKLLLTNDVILLSAPLIQSSPVSPARGVALIAGTGSMAISFCLLIPVQLDRVGGWGSLLGDEGSGYWIGREAIRAILKTQNGMPGKVRAESNEMTLEAVVLKHFGCWTVGELLSEVYRKTIKNAGDDQMSSVDPKERISSLAKVVLQLAFENTRGFNDSTALNIATEAAAHLADIVKPLICGLEPENRLSLRKLVLGGGLFRVGAFRELVISHLGSTGVVLDDVEFVEDVAGRGADALVQSLFNI